MRRLESYPAADQAVIFFPPAFDEFEMFRVFGRRRSKETLPVVFLDPNVGVSAALGPVPDVNAAALDRFVNPVGTAGDARKEDRTSRESAEAAGPNGLVNSWHGLRFGRRGASCCRMPTSAPAASRSWAAKQPSSSSKPRNNARFRCACGPSARLRRPPIFTDWLTDG